MNQGLLDLSETQRAVRDLVREFARKEVAPRAAAADEEGKFPMENFRRLAELSLTGIPVPAELGGAGADTLSFALAIEELAYACGSTALTLAAHTGLGTMPICNFGSEEQKRRFVPPLARGEVAGALCLTEPNLGSDLAATEVTAERVADRYRIRGTKMFVTNGSFAGTLIVSACTDRTARKGKRLTLFIVPRETPGVSVIKEEEKLGMRGSSTCLVAFDRAEVPAEFILGGEGNGFPQAIQTLQAGRITIAALALGLAEAAFDKARAHAMQRRQFGRPIAEFQAIQFKLADMHTDIEAARLLIHQAAVLKDRGLPFSVEASTAKLFAARMAMRVTSNAIQILGGMGFMQEAGVERLYRDAKLCEIGEGTNEIQQLILARHILQTT